MALVNSSTRWVLFLAASGEPEQRHIFDLAFGLLCLEKAGVSRNDIYIYIDGTDRAAIEKAFTIVSTHAYTVLPTARFFLDINVSKYDKLVMFVTGHGSIEGIDGCPPIKPFALTDALKKAPSLSQAIVYLGQCYAGIFNYTGAGRRVDKSGSPDPELIFLGATSLHESISSTTREAFPAGDLTWVANLFLLHVFKWISSPLDVDGDGRCTVIDSYKYAGVHSNTSNKGVKAGAFLNCMSLHPRWLEALQKWQADPQPQHFLALEGVKQSFNEQLSMHAVHQESWILNAIPAQHSEF